MRDLKKCQLARVLKSGPGARFNRHLYFWAIAGAEVRAQVGAQVRALLGDTIQ